MSALNETWKEAEVTDLVAYTRSAAPPWYRETFKALFRDVMIQRLRHGLPPGGRIGKVIDMGCGLGDWTVRYLDLAEEVVGVDINAGYVDVASRQAIHHADRSRIRFACCDLVDFDEYDGAGLVCFGGCVQYIDDHGLNRVFGKLSRSLEPGARVYVRTTVVNPLRGSHCNECGHYRSKQEYDALYARFGLETVDGFYSSAVVPSQLLLDFLGIGSFWGARALSSPVWLVLRLLRCLTDPNDFYNWLLVKR